MSESSLSERHRILIVDDDAADRQIVARALRREAAEIDGVETDVLEVDNIWAARVALQAEEFACVFLDHDLPDGTALDLLLEVRSQGLATPVVALTGRRDEQTVVEVMKAGALDYLPKERLHPDLIVRSLRAALRFRQSQREKQAVLDELRARDRAIAAATNGIVLADPRLPDCPLVYTNEAFLRMTGYTESEVIGRNCRFLQGRDTDPAAVRELREAVRAEHAVQVSILNHRKDGTAFWNEVTVSPVRDVQGRLTHFVGIQTDVTERHRAEAEREQAEETRREGETRFRALADNIAQLAWMADSGGAIFWYNQRWYDYTGTTLEETRGWGWRDLHHPDHLARAAEKFAEHIRAGAVWEDTFPLRGRDGSYRWFLSRAFPVRDEAGQVVLWCGTNTDVTAQRESEARLASAYRREALLNRIGQAVRQALPTEGVERTALAGLAEALGADRCLSILIDRDADMVRFTGDWHREGLPSLIGEYPFSSFGVMLEEVFPAGGTLVVPDTQTQPWSPQAAVAMARMGIRALVDVPLTQRGEVVGVLGAYMADAPRAWAGEDVALIEAVASQLRAASEAARVRAKEHAIAQQLQDALQPALPDHIPGLSVGRYTRPALDEASVGGDFFDVFSLDENLYAVVIGDVSGKGLAAAQQLALVRNSLRIALYLYRAAAQAAATLNRIVTAYDLLVGFVTCWIGVYDVPTGRIIYCSCGHEPPLIRRADGTIEALLTTGPPLGIDAEREYGTQTIILSAGDCLLLYTDGISEAGPSRREMLGTGGLMRLFEALPAGLDAQPLADALVSDVSAFTNGVFRDDVAVLLARRL